MMHLTYSLIGVCGKDFVEPSEFYRRSPYPAAIGLSVYIVVILVGKFLGL